MPDRRRADVAPRPRRRGRGSRACCVRWPTTALAVLLVVHDLALAAAIADEVWSSTAGRTVAAGPPHEVLDADRLAAVWRVDAHLEGGAPSGKTALHVAWLGDD